MRLNIHGLIDNAKCYAMVRQLRWSAGVECPHCHATEVIKNGRDETQTDRQRCGEEFSPQRHEEHKAAAQPDQTIWIGSE